MRSALSILISTIRSTAEMTEIYDRMRREGADEFSLARARRSMLDGVRAACLTADMAEALEARALESVEDQLAAMRHHRLGDPLSHDTLQPEPPSAA